MAKKNIPTVSQHRGSHVGLPELHSRRLEVPVEVVVVTVVDHERGGAVPSIGGAASERDLPSGSKEVTGDRGGLPLKVGDVVVEAHYFGETGFEKGGPTKVGYALKMSQKKGIPTTRVGSGGNGGHAP